MSKGSIASCLSCSPTTRRAAAAARAPAAGAGAARAPGAAGAGAARAPGAGAATATAPSLSRFSSAAASLSSSLRRDRLVISTCRPEHRQVYSLSSFVAQPEGEDSAAASQQQSSSSSSSRRNGMAEAFNISPKTATSITVAIFAAALVLPTYMQPLVAAASTKAKLLSFLTLLLGFYMAWNIGANDVANAMGTSVGSGALTLRQAVLTASVLEFSGAFMVGSHVTETMQNILVPGSFAGRDSLLFIGLISSLAAAGTWLQVASYCGWPVSTTHCIIGSLVGFGLVFGGVEAVYWTSLARVVSSWVVSPLLGAAVSFCVYRCIRTFVYSAPQPGLAAAAAAPIAVFVGVAAFSLTVLPFNGSPLIVAAEALACGALGAVIISWIIRRQLGDLIGDYCNLPIATTTEEAAHPSRNIFMDRVEGPKGTQLTIVYAIFGYLQVLSACFMSFAHGANDVANAIGPIAGALAILHGAAASPSSSSLQILAWGGFGIVAGLLVWGYRVMATIGKKITELTPTRGFAAEIAAASVVVGASRLGLPISATHTLVGAVMGVGFARGLNSVRGETVREIVASWVVTIPVGAVLAALYTLLLKNVITSLA